MTSDWNGAYSTPGLPAGTYSLETSNGRGYINQVRNDVVVFLRQTTGVDFELSTTVEIPQPERAALVALYESANGAGWTTRTNWLGAPGTECTWYGVVCDGATGTVRKLVLSRNELTGRIPAELRGLTALERLDLSTNRLNGNLPPELTELTNLQYVDLSDNQLTGAIPVTVSRLTNLRTISLHNNRLTGSIPGEMAELANLESLRLASNGLSGKVPPELTRLTNLDSGSSDSASDLRWNALYTDDPSLRVFLDEKQVGGDWESTQTIAPEGVTAVAASATSAALSWRPVDDTAYGSRYRVSVSTTPGGPYRPSTATADTTISSITVSGLAPATTYYFVVDAVTDPHAENQNTVISEPSAEVSATTSAPDLTPPALTLPADIVAVAATSAGAAVEFAASAVDGNDGEVAVTCSPASGSVFAPGSTAVTCTAADAAGNTASGRVDVQVVYLFSGFLPPIDPQGSSVFRAGRTVPTKFTLAAQDGTVIANAHSTIQVFKITDAVLGTREEVTPDAAGQSNVGNVFRFDGSTGQYVYNLKTTGYGTGSYTLRAAVNDGTVHEVRFSIR